MHVNIAARCIKLTYMMTRTKERSFTNIFLRGEVEEEEEKKKKRENIIKCTAK